MLKFRFKIILGFFVFSLFSCCAVNTGRVTSSGKIGLNLISDDTRISLNGVINVTRDSSDFNIYGPLGISLARIKVKFDSVYVVDLRNSRMYKSEYPNAGNCVYNLFNGVYSAQEQKLLASILKSTRNTKFDNDRNAKITYSYKGLIKKVVVVSFFTNEKEHSLKLKYVPNTKRNFKFSNLSKYSSFESSSIILQ